MSTGPRDKAIRSECPVCGNNRLANVCSLYDDRYAYDGRFTLMTCRECSAGFVRERLGEGEIKRLYESHYPASGTKSIRSGLLSVASNAMVAWVNRSPELAFETGRGGRVLDIGCGYGKSRGWVTLMGGDWVGLEADSRKVKTMNAAGMEAYSTPLVEFAAKQEGKFDYILASQVIEHFANPKEFLDPCRDLLTPSGKLVLSTPNMDSRHRDRAGDGWINYHVPYHQILYTRKALAAAGDRCGLRVERFETLTPSTWSIYQKLYRRPDKGKPGRWYEERIGLTAIVIDAIISRAGDRLRGRGDCIVATMRRGD